MCYYYHGDAREFSLSKTVCRVIVRMTLPIVVQQAESVSVGCSVVRMHVHLKYNKPCVIDPMKGHFLH